MNRRKRRERRGLGFRAHDESTGFADLFFTTPSRGDRLLVMVHSGSRAIGQAIRDLHLTGASPSASGLKWLDAESPAGQAYLADAAWAVAYAEASRLAMIAAVARLMQSLFGACAPCCPTRVYERAARRRFRTRGAGSRLISPQRSAQTGFGPGGCSFYNLQLVPIGRRVNPNDKCCTRTHP